MSALTKNEWRKRKATDHLAGYLFMAPTILIAGVFLILPIGYAIALAFQKVGSSGSRVKIV